MTSARTLILGAGLTGLSAAYHLSPTETVVVEREREVGGLCRSRNVDGFVFDNTGHVLHLKHAGIRDLVLTLLPDTFASIERKARVYSKGVYTAYPFQANTHGLPAAVVSECVLGFLEALRRRESSSARAFNLREWILLTFGDGIARHFMLPYNEKLYRQDLTTLDGETTSWSIPQPTLQEVVQGALGSEVRGLGYNPSFLYPKRGGIDVIPRALADRGGDLRLGTTVRRIDPVARRAELDGGHMVAYERLISTIPLDALLRMLDPAPDPMLREASSRLRAVRVININLGIDRAGVLPGHWIYFPEPEFPFYRVGSASNFSDGVAPTGCSSLYIEVTRRREEVVDLDTLRVEVVEALRRARILRASDRVVVEDTQILDPAYVVHDHDRQRLLPRIVSVLDRYGIVSTGRYGAWEYGSMETALRQGRQAAQRRPCAQSTRAVKGVR